MGSKERSKPARLMARNLAALGFVVLVVGITYGSILVVRALFDDNEDAREAAWVQLIDFVSGHTEWYLKASTFGAGSFVLAILSLLFGVHPLARITLALSGTVFIALQFA
jgi:hypothetical protein